MKHFKTRYPDVEFLLRLSSCDEVELHRDASLFESWLDHIFLEEVEVVYCIGLIGFPLPKKVIEWLNGRPERALIFVENILGAFATFNQDELFAHPQIHFHYQEKDPIQELAHRFPTEKLAIYAPKPFDVERLMRESATLSALYSDILYSHKIVENVLANFKQLSFAFDARGQLKGVPAIICGAGPSLEKAFPPLRDADQKGIIFAGGSAITALTKQGIQPHFAMALDPNREEFSRLKQSLYFEGPFLLAPRLHRDVFSTVNGPFGYMKTDTGGAVERWLEEKLGIEGPPIGGDLGREAFSVTTLAISYAYALGCNPIILVGVDLSFQEGKHYAQGIEGEERSQKDPRVFEQVIVRKNQEGKEVETLLKWVMEGDCISAFAKDHPQTTFINGSKGGLGFKGFKEGSLDEILKAFPSKDYRGKIHQWIQAHPLSFDPEIFYKSLLELEASLIRSSQIIHKILPFVEKQKESGKLLLYEMDLVEEIGYQCLLEGIDGALERVLYRYYPHIDPKQGEWERKLAKYKELDLQIQKFQKILQNHLSVYTS